MLSLKFSQSTKVLFSELTKRFQPLITYDSKGGVLFFLCPVMMLLELS